MSKINYQFKILYFLGIFFIVCGHCGNTFIQRDGGLPLFTDWFPYYSFHLGLFIFCSGYFFHKEDSNNIFKYFKKKFKKLIIPFFIWNIIYGIIAQILKIKGFLLGGELNLYNVFVAPFINGHQFSYNHPSWFIVPLFFILIINAVAYKIFNKFKINDLIVCVIYLLFGMFGIFLSICGFNTGIWLLLVRTLFLLPFYSLGILYKNHLEKHDKISNTKYFALLFGIQLIIFTIAHSKLSYTVSWCKNFDNVYNPYLVGITGIAFWLRISKILTPILKNNKIVMLIANNTFSIMMHHMFGFMVLKGIFGILSNFIIAFNNFSWHLFKTQIYYVYLPYNLNNWKLVYVIFGIAFSLFIKFICDKLVNILNKNNFYKLKRKLL